MPQARTGISHPASKCLDALLQLPGVCADTMLGGQKFHAEMMCSHADFKAAFVMRLLMELHQWDVARLVLLLPHHSLGPHAITAIMVWQ